MRDFQNAYPNDGYTKFDKEYSCWANNPEGGIKSMINSIKCNFLMSIMFSIVSYTTVYDLGIGVIDIEQMILTLKCPSILCPTHT